MISKHISQELCWDHGNQGPLARNLDLNLPKNSLCIKAIPNSHLLPCCKRLRVWKIFQCVKLLCKHPNHKVQMCSQTVTKLGFDEILIAETSFVFNRTNNLDHSNFCQLHILRHLMCNHLWRGQTSPKSSHRVQGVRRTHADATLLLMVNLKNDICKSKDIEDKTFGTQV
jgi:hypothetical protein